MNQFVERYQKLMDEWPEPHILNQPQHELDYNTTVKFTTSGEIEIRQGGGYRAHYISLSVEEAKSLAHWLVCTLGDAK